jgi:hypothetical protein
MTSRAIVCAVDSSIPATPAESTTVISGSACGAPDEEASRGSGRAGMPAATTSAA